MAQNEEKHIAQSEEKTITQSEEKTVTLGEVVVKAAKVVNKMDGMELYPTEVQKKSSSNGYDILQKLSLPDDSAVSVPSVAV